MKYSPSVHSSYSLLPTSTPLPKMHTSTSSSKVLSHKDIPLWSRFFERGWAMGPFTVTLIPLFAISRTAWAWCYFHNLSPLNPVNPETLHLSFYSLLSRHLCFLQCRELLHFLSPKSSLRTEGGMKSQITWDRTLATSVEDMLTSGSTLEIVSRKEMFEP